MALPSSSGRVQSVWSSSHLLQFHCLVHVLVKNLPTLMLFGVLITGIGAVFYIRGVTGVNAITGSVLTLLEPVSCIFFDCTIIGNPIHRGMIIGCIFILAAAVIVSLDNVVFLKRLIFGEKQLLSKDIFRNKEF